MLLLLLLQVLLGTIVSGIAYWLSRSKPALVHVLGWIWSAYWFYRFSVGAYLSFQESGWFYIITGIINIFFLWCIVSGLVMANRERKYRLLES